jgi:hypothetical protein
MTRNTQQRERREEKDLLYEIARWRIHKKNTKDHLEMWREIFDYAKSHSEILRDKVTDSSVGGRTVIRRRNLGMD